MITKEEVDKFLQGFFIKVKVFDIRFLDHREKNQNALFDLQITQDTRLAVVMDIKCEDYSAGPIPSLEFGDMWVFGKALDDTEVYIKISLGEPNSHTICISFHRAEHPIKYAFKN